jgi:hypothetical protein
MHAVLEPCGCCARKPRGSRKTRSLSDLSAATWLSRAATAPMGTSRKECACAILNRPAANCARFENRVHGNGRGTRLAARKQPRGSRTACMESQPKLTQPIVALPNLPLKCQLHEHRDCRYLGRLVFLSEVINFMYTLKLMYVLTADIIKSGG